MKIKVKIGEPDMDGFCGRDFHPEREDAGKIGALLSMEPIGDDLNSFLVRLHCGRLVELVDHEIEAICGPFWNDPEPEVLELSRDWHRKVEEELYD